MNPVARKDNVRQRKKESERLLIDKWHKKNPQLSHSKYMYCCGVVSGTKDMYCGIVSGTKDMYCGMYCMWNS